MTEREAIREAIRELAEDLSMIESRAWFSDHGQFDDLAAALDPHFKAMRRILRRAYFGEPASDPAGDALDDAIEREADEPGIPSGFNMTFTPEPLPDSALGRLNADVEAFRKGEAPPPFAPTRESETMSLPVDATPRAPKPVEHVRVRDLCAELEISESQFYRWKKEKKVRTYKLPGKRGSFVNRDDVHLLRAVAATMPGDRTSVASWISRSFNRVGR